MTLTLMMKKPDVLEAHACSHSQLYREIKAELFTPGIPKGRRQVAWPAHEVDAINRAEIAGMSVEERKALVQQLLAQRAQMKPEVAI